MKNLRKLELVVASWCKDMPHLPENGRKWIAKNIWWLTLVGVILGAIGIFSVLSALLAGAAIVGLSGSVDAVDGIMLWGIFVTLLFATANVIVGAVAITPLKSLRKQGWSLLFAAALINVMSLVVSFLFNLNIFSLAYGLIFAAIGVYFLFEIRGLYREVRPVGKRAAKGVRKT